MTNKTLWWIGWIAVTMLTAPLGAGQEIAVPSILNKRYNPNEVISLQLAPGFGTLIQLPEMVEGVYLGDPAKFQAEWADRDVYVKPVTSEAGHTNLFVRTASGRHIRFYLRSEGGDVPPPDRVGAHAREMTYVVNYAGPPGFLMITPKGWNEVTGSVSGSGPGPGIVPPAYPRPRLAPVNPKEARLETLFEERPADLPVKKFEGDGLQGTILKVTEEGSTLYVLFRVRNNGKRVLRLLEPQVLLDTMGSKGALRPGTKIESSEWLPRIGIRLESRRLDPGQTADGMIAVEVPPALDSNQKIVLTLSDSLQADKPLRLHADLGHHVLDSTP